MVGDTLLTHRSGVKLFIKTKVHEVPKPEVFKCYRAFIGFAGSARDIGRAVGWLHLPDGKPPKLRDTEFLLLTDQKKIYHGTSLSSLIEIEEPYFAIGSGMQYALAAMAAGKGPFEAVTIAHRYDGQTGAAQTSLTM